MSLEILHLPLVLFCCSAALESTEISSLARAGVLFARIQPVSARLESSNHHSLLAPLGAEET